MESLYNKGEDDVEGNDKTQERKLEKKLSSVSSNIEKKVSRQAKGNEQTRKEIVINHANAKIDMAQDVCGRSKGPNAKCCNANMCRALFLDRDAPEGLQDLTLITTVLLLRAELYPKDGVQVM